MEQKKSKEANLENKKIGFFFVGFVMISALVGMAFEYSQVIPDPTEYAQTGPKQVEMIYDLTEEEEIIEEEPEIAPPPPMTEEIVVVEDDEIVPEIDFSKIEVEIEDIKPIEVKVVEEKVYDFPEVEPEFPGGAGEMNRWIASKIEYPELSKEMGEQGMVYVKFVVGSDGTVQNVKIAKSVSDALDAEAKRVVKMMPKWTPGEQAGRPVPVNFTLPINFQIR